MAWRFNVCQPCCGCCCHGTLGTFVANGGIGYAVGDIIEAIAPGCSIAPRFVVVSLASPTFGDIATIGPAAMQCCEKPPGNPVATKTITGSGSGATLRLTWSACCPCGGDDPDNDTGCSVFQISIGSCTTALVSQPISDDGTCHWTGQCPAGPVDLAYCQRSNTWTLTLPDGSKVTSVGVPGQTPNCPPFSIGGIEIIVPPSPTYKVKYSVSDTWWYCAGAVIDGNATAYCVQKFDLSGTFVFPGGLVSAGTVSVESGCNCFYGPGNGFRGCNCGPGPACIDKCDPHPSGGTATNNIQPCGYGGSGVQFSLQFQLSHTPTGCCNDPTGCDVGWVAFVSLLVNGIGWCSLQGTATSKYVPGQPLPIPATFTEIEPGTGADFPTCWYCPDEFKLNFSMFTFSAA